MIKLLSLLLLVLLCVGCAALPSAVKISSWIHTGADVVSYVETEKTTTDHAISYVLKKDCNMFNVLDNDPICSPRNTVLLNQMLEAVCETFTVVDDIWTDKNEPYCKKDIDRQM